jgi:hypothetical protein
VSAHEPLELPTRFTGHFGLVIYHQSHGQLLIRSHDRDDGGPKRIDLLFKGVVWMSLPAWFESFTLEQRLIDEVVDRIPRSLRGKVESRKLFRLEIEGQPQYVIAGSVFAAADDGSYFDPSPLLPEIEVNLRFEDGAG